MHNIGTPEFIALKEKVEAHDVAIAEMRGSLQQLEKIVTDTARQSVWQLIALVVTLSGVSLGGFAYQSATMEKRLDQMEKNFNERLEKSDKNINVRFEDLKQEVRASRK